MRIKRPESPSKGLRVDDCKPGDVYESEAGNLLLCVEVNEAFSRRALYNLITGLRAQPHKDATFQPVAGTFVVGT